MLMFIRYIRYKGMSDTDTFVQGAMVNKEWTRRSLGDLLDPTFFIIWLELYHLTEQSLHPLTITPWYANT